MHTTNMLRVQGLSGGSPQCTTTQTLGPVMGGVLAVLIQWREPWKVGLNFGFVYSLELIVEFLILRIVVLMYSLQFISILS